MTVGRYFHLDGQLLANGGAATGGNGGGGSGGSIHANVLVFSGHGQVANIGGNGYGYGFGGAGGRSLVNCDWHREFSGLFFAHGGLCGDSCSDGAGAAGTSYFTDNPRGPEFAKYDNTTGEKIPESDTLLIDNYNLERELPTVIESEDGLRIEINTVEAYNNVTLEYTGHEELDIDFFIGDRSGRFTVKENQKMLVEYVASEITYTIAPVSFNTHENSTLVTPSDTVLLGTRTIIQGILAGVYNLTIAEGATVS